MTKILLLALVMAGTVTMAHAQSAGAGSSSYGGVSGATVSPPSSLPSAPPSAPPSAAATSSPSADIQNSQQPGIGVNNSATTNSNLQPGTPPPPRK